MSDIVAVFWDFEQLHLALLQEKLGKQPKVAANYVQPRVIDVAAVMDHARSFGQVVHNEACSNWQNMSRYASKLQLEDTVHLHVWPADSNQRADAFPTLFARVKDHVDKNEEITDVVLVGFDDDYVQLADDLKDIGCKVHAVGATEIRDKEWAASCDDYTTYFDLEGTGNGFSRPEPRRPHDLAKHYLRVAAQQGVRMPPPKVMWIGIDIYSSFLHNSGKFASFKELDDECYDQLVRDIPGATMTEVKKIRQVLFKCYLFRPSEDGMISFQDKIKTLEDIEDCYFDLMLKRIANNLKEPTDYAALSRALTGTEDSAARLEKQHAGMRSEV